MDTRIISIDPHDLKLLPVNARYMKHETYEQLVKNIKRDGKLTSVPFACREPDGTYLVLSGNHRVKAARDAGLQEIDVMVTDEDLDHEQRVALQLSHNALTGEDDPSILKDLFESLSVEWKDYAGLDDKTLKLLDEVSIDSLSEANLDFTTLTLAFLPDELDRVSEVFAQVKAFTKGSKAVFLARMADYDRLLDSLESASDAGDIKNQATALLILLEIVERHIGELTDAWLDQTTQQPKRTKGMVPVAAILGTPRVPVAVAAAVQKAIEKLVAQGEIAADQRHEGLTLLAQGVLGE
jgi:hypothetical protein